MATGIRIPVDVGISTRNGYGDRHEDSRARMQMDAGPDRVWRTMRTAPRRFDIQFELSQIQFAIFDKWWQDTIKGGALPFDIQLLDDDETLVWYTVYWVGGEYKSEIVGEYPDNWRISGTVRAKGASFATRPSGTDELRGLSRPTVVNRGRLVIGRTLRGLSSVEVTGYARFAPGPMYGLSEPSVVGRGRLGLTIMNGLSEPEVTGYGELLVGYGKELRDDGSFELRDDGSFELRG